jgi:hypothetical protein
MSLELADEVAVVDVEYAPCGVRLVPRPGLFALLGAAGAGGPLVRSFRRISACGLEPARA